MSGRTVTDGRPQSRGVPLVPTLPIGVSSEVAAVVGLGLVALVSVAAVSLAAVVALTSLLLLTPALAAGGDRTIHHVRTTALVMVFAVVVIRFLAGFESGPVGFTLLVSMPATIGVGVLAWRAIDVGSRLRWLAAGALVVTVLAVGFTWIHLVERPEIDVLELHIAAAEIVTAGGNPYVEARVADTHPDAVPGAMLVGYPYPPITLAAFASSHLLFGDPRWASVVAVALTVLLLTRPWGLESAARARATLGVALLLVLQPELGPIFRNAWTEPVALPFLIGSGMLWRRRPLVAAGLLGVALGTKQYWIVVVPLLVLWRDEHRWPRVVVAGATAAVTLVPAFLLDAAAAWRSLVTELAALAPRSDSIGLAAIGWSLPLVLLLPICVGVAAWMSRVRSVDPHRFLLAVAATLAAAFLLGSQAFENYWFLIAATSAGAVVIVTAHVERVVGPPPEV